MIEKRNFTRIAFDANARLHKGEESCPTKLLDISLKGALVKQPEALPLSKDDQVTLYLLLSDEETEICMQGKVAHLAAEQVGIVCEHIDVDSASHLRRIVELNTGSEFLLEREIEALINYGS
ncbi:PilZ domain-containing protein [Ketobacter sp. MCCC 1A13808]|uniref:PilZ domain-containing protein n=1 Tax=Ketobacter sp. MCCC 1A13808 TaxID=2602738 RepID=UPI0012EBC97D|nr:PilZ domain-containing protein [Ketobacter sp. MCCC 1A13808]MVF11425.1 PilZ domain-containing protein [Ketobacter sp. MCCC 1A13808]